MRRMARRAAFNLEWRVLKYERALLVRVTLETARISTCRKARLFEFKTAVRVMTITALNQTLEHLVMKRPAKLRFCFGMTTDTELRLARTQHVCGQQVAIASL